jgi:hypothetical protein
MLEGITVKVSNFGPLWTPFPRGLAIVFLQKIEEIESWWETSDLQTRFCSFLAHNSGKEAMDFARKGLKLEVFTVQGRTDFPFRRNRLQVGSQLRSFHSGPALASWCTSCARPYLLCLGEITKNFKLAPTPIQFDGFNLERNHLFLFLLLGPKKVVYDPHNTQKRESLYVFCLTQHKRGFFSCVFQKTKVLERGSWLLLPRWMLFVCDDISKT